MPNDICKVSVIIPNYNYACFLVEAIESVLAQTYPIHEIIVVDDGSTDNSIEVIKQFGDQIKLICQKNSGVSTARNNGVKYSSGDFIAFLDADDVWLPTKTEKQLQLLLSDKKIGFVTCGIREFDNCNRTIEINLNGQNGWKAEELLLFRPVVVGPGSTALIPRKVFEQVGGFDERSDFHGAEDWEFCYRIACATKLGFVNEVLVDYRNHGNGNHLKINRVERAMMLAYEKIFTHASEKTLKLRNQAYGNFHTILAGSYFQAKNYPAFFSNMIKSLRFTPQNITHYLMFPTRYFKRRFHF
jgi:glycosyltransferase involved in cell wall biosynthesis